MEQTSSLRGEDAGAVEFNRTARKLGWLSGPGGPRTGRIIWATCLLLVVFSSVVVASAQDVVPHRRGRAEELARLASRFAEAGDRVSARAFLRESIHADPSYEPAYVALGALEIERGSFRDAEATFRVGLGRARPTVALYLGLSRALLGLGAIDEAERVLDVAEAQLGPDADLLWRALELAESRGRWSRALRFARRLVDLLEARGDSANLEPPRARVRALERLVGLLDPVTAPRRNASLLRRALRRSTSVRGARFVE